MMKNAYKLIIVLIIVLFVFAIVYFLVLPNMTGLAASRKSSGCIALAGLPDGECTPGAVFNVTAKEICVSGYSSRVRDVSQSLKEEVYAEYGITTHKTGEYEVDHLIPLEIGGSNDISNLWPEAAEPKPGCHEKDRVENYLHKIVCNGTMPLEDAQRMIATNWTAVWVRIQ